uniref:Peroxisomal membrane protein 2 n=1 Tax=Fibrocapsa japonica TaxID=94617 RepID=A0A7S2XX76_9STRA|mmetsp:Transcript_17680/g.25814  ORF Transcript_17680/g.25814 Transcript_17680/m.25814 type:complete len:262 (+) Transcript_17680:69-854(+)
MKWTSWTLILELLLFLSTIHAASSLSSPIFSATAVKRSAAQEKVDKAAPDFENQMETAAGNKHLAIKNKPVETKFMYSLWKLYNESLKQHPLLTKMVLGAVVGFLGDLFYQIWRQNKLGIPIDLYRMSMFVVVTIVYHTPALHIWFELSDKVSRRAKSKAVQVGGLIFADNFLLCPLLLPLFVFFGALLCSPDIFSVPFMETVEGAIAQMKREAWPLLKTTWKIWPLFHLMNYSLVPHQHRLLVTYIANIAFKFILSSCIK